MDTDALNAAAARAEDAAQAAQIAAGQARLAAERGGNVEVSKQDDVITTPNGVTIIRYKNWPARLATSSSSLYARNLFAFLETMFDKKTKAFAVNWDDELVKATVLTKDGAIVHPNIKVAA